jgi:hypothetical protein
MPAQGRDSLAGRKKCEGFCENIFWPRIVVIKASAVNVFEKGNDNNRRKDRGTPSSPRSRLINSIGTPAGFRASAIKVVHKKLARGVHTAVDLAIETGEEVFGMADGKAYSTMAVVSR